MRELIFGPVDHTETYRAAMLQAGLELLFLKQQQAVLLGRKAEIVQRKIKLARVIKALEARFSCSEN